MLCAQSSKSRLRTPVVPSTLQPHCQQCWPQNVARSANLHGGEREHGVRATCLVPRRGGEQDC
eukprot:10061884-Alexandrium_andersonii.AAC.1